MKKRGTKNRKFFDAFAQAWSNERGIRVLQSHLPHPSRPCSEIYKEYLPSQKRSTRAPAQQFIKNILPSQKRSTRAPAQQFIKNILPSQKRSPPALCSPFRLPTRGQLTIFIIIAILIVAFVVLFFIFRGGIQREKFASPEVVPIKIKNKTTNATINI